MQSIVERLRLELEEAERQLWMKAAEEGVIHYEGVGMVSQPGVFIPEETKYSHTPYGMVQSLPPVQMPIPQQLTDEAVGVTKSQSRRLRRKRLKNKITHLLDMGYVKDQTTQGYKLVPVNSPTACNIMEAIAECQSHAVKEEATTPRKDVKRQPRWSSAPASLKYSEGKRVGREQRQQEIPLNSSVAETESSNHVLALKQELQRVAERKRMPDLESTISQFLIEMKQTAARIEAEHKTTTARLKKELTAALLTCKPVVTKQTSEVIKVTKPIPKPVPKIVKVTPAVKPLPKKAESKPVEQPRKQPSTKTDNKVTKTLPTKITAIPEKKKDLKTETAKVAEPKKSIPKKTVAAKVVKVEEIKPAVVLKEKPAPTKAVDVKKAPLPKKIAVPLQQLSEAPCSPPTVRPPTVEVKKEVKLPNEIIAKKETIVELSPCTSHCQVKALSHSGISDILSGDTAANLVRNLAIVAHVDAGKTTLCDVLLEKAMLIGKGATCAMDSSEDEKNRGITIKSAAVTLGYEFNDQQVVVNLIDCPGHVDFSSEVTTSLRVSDGALIVLDCIEGVQVQTEAVIRAVIREKVKPCAVLNKLDRMFCQLHLDSDAIYQRLYESISTLGGLFLSDDEDIPSYRTPPSPINCDTCFTAGLQGWGFSIQAFATLILKRHSRKTGNDEHITQKAIDNLSTKLWSPDWLIDTATMKFTKKKSDTTKRSFSYFILDKIYAILNAQNDEQKQTAIAYYWPDKVTVALKESSFNGIMRILLPAANALIDVANRAAPSPKTAQVYRASVLADVSETELYNSIRDCDPSGPLVMYVSKMIPIQKTWNFFGLARVFSGSVKAGLDVVVSSLDGDLDRDDKKHKKNRKSKIQGLMMMRGPKQDRLASNCSAGSLLGLNGIDSDAAKTCTITTGQSLNLNPLHHDLTPVVSTSVTAKPEKGTSVTAGSAKTSVVRAVKWLNTCDPLVKCQFTKDEVILVGAGELHLEVCQKQIQDRVGSSVRIEFSQPSVPYKETIIGNSEITCLAKSPNKLNRLYCTVEPFDVDNIKEEKSVLYFNPVEAGDNILCNNSYGVTGLHDVLHHLIEGFKQIMNCGVLCGEKVSGVRVNIEDAMIHTDSAHRGPAEITPTMRKAVSAAMLSSGITLLEPVFTAKFNTSVEHAGSVRSIIPRRRGLIFEECHTSTSVLLTGNLPVRSSFGLTQELRAVSSGRTSMQCHFSHFNTIPDALIEDAISETRSRKGLPKEVSVLKDFLDKL